MCVMCNLSVASGEAGFPGLDLAFQDPGMPDLPPFLPPYIRVVWSGATGNSLPTSMEEPETEPMSQAVLDSTEEPQQNPSPSEPIDVGSNTIDADPIGGADRLDDAELHGSGRDAQIAGFGLNGRLDEEFAFTGVRGRFSQDYLLEISSDHKTEDGYVQDDAVTILDRGTFATEKHFALDRLGDPVSDVDPVESLVLGPGLNDRFSLGARQQNDQVLIRLSSIGVITSDNFEISGPNQEDWIF